MSWDLEHNKNVGSLCLCRPGAPTSGSQAWDSELWPGLDREPYSRSLRRAITLSSSAIDFWIRLALQRGVSTSVLTKLPTSRSERGNFCAKRDTVDNGRAETRCFAYGYCVQALPPKEEVYNNLCTDKKAVFVEEAGLRFQVSFGEFTPRTPPLKCNQAGLHHWIVTPHV